MPWAVSPSLGDDKFFFETKHNIYAFFMILLGLFDLELELSVKFSCELLDRKFKKTNFF